MTRESMVSSYNTEEALGDKPIELVRPTNHVQEPNTIHRQIVEVRNIIYLNKTILSKFRYNFNLSKSGMIIP